MLTGLVRYWHKRAFIGHPGEGVAPLIGQKAICFLADEILG